MNKKVGKTAEGHGSHGEGAINEQHAQAFQGFLELIGKKHTLDIIHVIIDNDGVSRFNQIMEGTGASPKTVTTRLRELCEEGILERTAYPEIPPRVEYSLTEKGEGTIPIMESIWNWCVKWGTTN